MKSASNEDRAKEPAQISKWVARYRASGLSLKRFAEEHRIPHGRLQYWVYQKSRNGSFAEPAPATRFEEVPLPELLRGSGWAAEICLRQGPTVRISASASPEWIGALVQQLISSC
jgi:hypothetical protein